MKITEQQHKEGVETLKRCFPEGSTVFTILRHRSRSGMSRVYSVVSIKAGQASWPNFATVAGTGRFTYVDNIQGSNGVKMNGCGFSGSDEIREAISSAVGYRLEVQAL